MATKKTKHLPSEVHHETPQSRSHSRRSLLSSHVLEVPHDGTEAFGCVQGRPRCLPSRGNPKSRRGRLSAIRRPHRRCGPTRSLGRRRAEDPARRSSEESPPAEGHRHPPRRWIDRRCSPSEGRRHPALVLHPRQSGRRSVHRLHRRSQEAPREQPRRRRIGERGRPRGEEGDQEAHSDFRLRFHLILKEDRLERTEGPGKFLGLLLFLFSAFAHIRARVYTKRRNVEIYFIFYEKKINVF